MVICYPSGLVLSLGISLIWYIPNWVLITKNLHCIYNGVCVGSVRCEYIS